MSEDAKDIYSPHKPTLYRILKSALNEITLVIISLLILLGIVNYFGIFPVSKTFPILSFLPEKSAPPPIPKTTAIPIEQTPAFRRTLPFISCPVVKEKCATGQPVTETVNGATRYGIKFSNISKDASVSASIPGKIASVSATSFFIASKERGMDIEYAIVGSFKPSIASASSVLEKQTIGSFTRATNTLTIYATGNIVKQSIKLGVGENGKYLTNQD